MTKDELIKALRKHMAVMEEWARSVSDETIDGHDMRENYSADLELADALRRVRPSDEEEQGMKAILVTTQHRGVYYGEVPDDQDMNAKTMALKNARCAIYWATTKGVAELASDGPNTSSKIGAACDIEALHDITAVWNVSEAAAVKWSSY